MKKVYIFLVSLLIPFCAQHSTNPLVSKIVFLKGNVVVNEKPASLQQIIAQGDVIVVKGSSLCRIVIAEGNVISLQNNARMRYTAKLNSVTCGLEKGFLAAVLKNKKILKSFKVNTPTIVASVRGTSFFIGVENNNKVYTCICNGSIYYQIPGQEEEREFSATHHSALYYSREHDRIRVKKAPLKYHDDTFMNNLAAQINETIDWTSYYYE